MNNKNNLLTKRSLSGKRVVKGKNPFVISNFNDLNKNAKDYLFYEIGEFLALVVLNDNPLDNQNFKVTLKPNNNYGTNKNTDTANLSNRSNECIKSENKLPIFHSTK